MFEWQFVTNSKCNSRDLLLRKFELYITIFLLLLWTSTLKVCNSCCNILKFWILPTLFMYEFLATVTTDTDCIVRHHSLQTLPDLRNSYFPEGPTQAETESYIRPTTYVVKPRYTRVQLKPNIQHGANRWQQHGRSIFLSPSNILSPPSSECAFISARKNSALF